MTDELETILRLVADGTLTPEQAAPIVDALTRAADRGPERASRMADRAGRQVARAQRRVERARERALNALGAAAGAGRGRRLRIRVTERGRQVVNLQIPIGFVDAALGLVPGLGHEQGERIREAVASGQVGPILDVEDPDGDGVLISVE